MAQTKLNIQQLFRQPDLVAAMLPAGDVFGFLSRTLRLPSDFAALVIRSHGERTVVRPGAEIAADGANEVLFVRTAPFDLRISTEHAPTRDKYLCKAVARVRVSAVSERAELDSFRTQVLGSHPHIEVSAIARHVESCVTDALRRFAAEHEVEALADGKLREPAAAAVREALAPALFESGLELAAPVRAEFESEALRELRAKEAMTARQLEEHAAQQQLDTALAGARAKHLDNLAETLKRLQDLSAASPDAEMPELLRTFTESERGKLYGALFESQPIPTVTRWLVAACGPNLMFFAPESPESPARQVMVEGPIGALRSVQVACAPDGQPRLFAGAARGVYELALEGSAPQSVYAFEEGASVRGGVNAVAVLGNELFASHSELGLLRWELGSPQRGAACLPEITRGARAVRNVHAADGRIIFSVDNRVVAFRPGAAEEPSIYTGSRAVITAALALGDDMLAGNAEGEVLLWPQRSTAAPRVLHGGSGRAAESLAVLSAGGVRRILYTDTTLAVFARVLGDPFVWRYEAGGQTIRRADVAADWIVGTTDARDRLVLWRPNQLIRPVATINLARMTGHTIQDVTLTPLA